MVALLTSDPICRLSTRKARSSKTPPVRHLRPVSAPPVRAACDQGRTPSQSAAHARIVSQCATVGLVCGAIVLALLVLVAFRAMQGQPPSGSWADVQQAARVDPPVAHQDDALWSVQPGETLWEIAQIVAPGADRREVVQILTEANGGSSIWAGQQIVIPARLARIGGEFAAWGN